MLYRVLRYVLAPLLMSASLPVAMAADQIVWGKYNVPPYMIRTGEWAEQGIFDQTLDVLKEKMPQYQHVELEAPFPRINREIKKGSHWCYNGTLKTPERESYGYFLCRVRFFSHSGSSYAETA